MRPGVRRALWVTGIAAATVVLLLGAFAAALAVQLSGGVDELFDRTHPTQDDPEVVAARAEASSQLEAQLRGLAERVVVPAIPGSRVAPSSAGTDPQQSGAGPGSECAVGQHNWKRDDPFDLACVEVRHAVVVAPTMDVPATLVALDRALQAGGWRPEAGAGLARAMEDRQPVSPSSPGSGTRGPVTGPTPLTPADLPRAWYRSQDGRFALALSFDDFEFTTGRPPPTIGPEEFGILLELSTQSYWA
ncbi:MAG TPA: hypothetical protein VF143_04300 [Candidatus Nanopelagicales bacterium]